MAFTKEDFFRNTGYTAARVKHAEPQNLVIEMIRKVLTVAAAIVLFWLLLCDNG